MFNASHEVSVKAGTTTAPSSPNPQGAGPDRWRLLGGERFYTLARWVTILLLFAITRFMTGTPIWPITTESQPLVMMLWAYAAFSLLASMAVFIPGTGQLISLAYLIDIGFISLMAFFGGDQFAIFFPLYLLPLINAAIRQPPAVSLLSGIAAAVLYIAAFIGWSYLIKQSGVTSIEYVALGLRGLILSMVPWMTSGLAERWSENNRQSVAVAQRQSDQALTEARAYRDQMRSLYEVAYSLSTTMDYRHVLESALRESRRLVPYTCGFVLLSSGNEDELYVAASQSLSISDQSRSLMAGRSGLADILRSAEARTVDVTQQRELQVFESLRSCRSACIIPLRAALRTYGLMVVATDRAASFTGEQIDMLSALSSYAIIALHNAQLIFDLQEERTKLISKEEEVRHQLARDLHDGPAQSIAAITMNIEFIKKLLERDPKRVIDELDKLSAMAKRTTYEVRTMLFELRPLVLETQGLKVTLEQYLERFKGNNAGTQIVLETNEMGDVHLDTKTEGTLFNIIQEAVNNALKHAKAKHIWVRMRSDGKTLHAVVQDDGAGFDKAAVMRTYEKRGSFGLLNIDERARLVGGQADMESAIGQGTKVTIVVPIG
ncbi:GAF domain-containing sensor histidine kinase [Oscillochloris sp. ZM17-4]|nr:GAF domain-containing sensor histidine kinase [Oscillochloris sp. ZM17-4]